MSYEEALKAVELNELIEVPIRKRPAEIGEFLAKHYGDDPTLLQISQLLLTEPKQATNSSHLKGVSQLDLWRDVMVGSYIFDENMSEKDAIRAQADLENRDDPDATVSEKSIKGSLARVRKAEKLVEQKRHFSRSQSDNK